MMIVFIFLAILISLFSVIAIQFLANYKDVYTLWIKEIVYNDYQYQKDRSNLADLCSKVESLTRQFHTLNNSIAIVLSLIFFSFIVVFSMIIIVFPLLEQKEKIIILTASFLALSLFSVFPIIAYFFRVKIGGIISQSEKMLFDIWFKNNCHRCKSEKFKNRLQPRRLYEIYAHKIQMGEIVPSSEITNLLEPLFKRFPPPP